MKKFKFKKTLHQFFPIDCNSISKKFINYWKPSRVFFIDSEIWPNTLHNLDKKDIPIVLLNGRITKKTFNRWLIFPEFSKSIFSKFSLCLSSSRESRNFLKRLGAKNIKLIGNLKYSQSENEGIDLNKNLKKFIFSRNSWCASSTHNNEEEICGKVHLILMKKYKNLLTIIIPRHIDRVSSIKDQLLKMNLRVHLDEPKKKISSNTDVYLVNSYGKTKSFYKVCKNVFLGGSLVKHGGQNPLEAVRYGCNIIHGPNISNFKEIYEFLKKKDVSNKVLDYKQLTSVLYKTLKKKNRSKKIIQNLHSVGVDILNKTYKEICK